MLCRYQITFNMSATVLTSAEAAKAKINLITDEAKGNQAVHDVVVAIQAARRSGTACAKTKAEVNLSGRKPWRQKGTGRARAGTIRSPIWRSGGVTFAAKPQDHSKKLNKKMYRAGMRSIFSQLAREGRLNVVDDFNLDAPKTKLLAEKVKAMGLESVLIILDKVDENLYLAARNLHKVSIVEPKHADPLSLVHYQNILVGKSAIAQIEEMLK